MMRFASLSRNDIGYLVEKKLEFRQYRGAVGWGHEYRTYGDGLAQHSPESPITLENMGDFLASLATYMLSAHASKEEKALLERCWPSGFEKVSRNTFRFLSGLRHQDDKPVYFNLNDLKTSTNQNKQHDRQWQTVPKWADGSPATVYALAYRCLPDRGEFRDALEQYLLYEHIRNMNGEENDWGGQSAEEWLKSTDPYLGAAVAAIDYMITSYRLLKNASKRLESYLRNTAQVCNREQAA